jgi:hypothetical protein
MCGGDDEEHYSDDFGRKYSKSSSRQRGQSHPKTLEVVAQSVHSRAKSYDRSFLVSNMAAIDGIIILDPAG